MILCVQALLAFYAESAAGALAGEDKPATEAVASALAAGEASGEAPAEAIASAVQAGAV